MTIVIIITLSKQINHEDVQANHFIFAHHLTLIVLFVMHIDQIEN